MIAGPQDSLSIDKALECDESLLTNQSTVATIGLQQLSLQEEELTESSDTFLSQQQTPTHIPRMVKNVTKNIPQFIPRLASNWLFYDDISPLSRRVPPNDPTLTLTIPQLTYRLNCEKFFGQVPAKSVTSGIKVQTPHSVESFTNELWLVRLKLNQQKQAVQRDYQFIAESQFEGLLVSTTAPSLSISKKKEVYSVQIEAGAQESVTLLHLNQLPVGRIYVRADELHTPLFEGFCVQETKIVSGESVWLYIQQNGRKFGIVKIKTSVLEF